MRKKIISAIILIAAGFLCSLMIFDGIDFQILTFSAFFIIALISVNSIEKVGKLFYLTDLIPVFLKGTSEVIGKISFFERFTGFLNKAIEKLGIEYSLNNETAYAVFVYFIVIVVLLFVSKKDNSAIGVAVDDEPEFKEKSYSDQLEHFCNKLQQQLESLNHSANWSDSFYVPVAAEVEMTRKRTKKRYPDLLKCLKKNRKAKSRFLQKFFRKLSRTKLFGYIKFIKRINKSLSAGRVFLVLGEPGSGKSVSLRKLCSELISEAKITHRVPVYVNLKEWSDDGKPWSMDNLPNEKDILSFIKKTLYSSNDIFADQFIDEYFDKMYENGRWYFIFDSFDEMPCLLSEGNKTELINSISDLFNRFLSLDNQPGGIIASRLYHSPADSLNPAMVLNIQPFNEVKIKEMFKKYLFDKSDDISRDFFLNGKNLVYLCRNPFYLSLFIDYYKKNQSFPEGQFELFSSFINKRLEDCSEYLQRNRIDINDIRDAAKEMALQMQNDDYGLDFPCEVLYSRPKKEQYWRRMLNALAYAKLCRFGGTPETVSFVHRRFQEFFFVENTMDGKRDITAEDYSCILHRTGLRDTLVLYCEVAELERVKKIATYCFNTVKANFESRYSIYNTGCIELVNTLEFMSEAFRNRREAVSDFLTEFESLIEKCFNKAKMIKRQRKEKHNWFINILHMISPVVYYSDFKPQKSTDYIVQISAVKTIALFNREKISSLFLKIFSLGRNAINDLLVSNCYTMDKVNRDIEHNIINHFLSMRLSDLIYNFKNSQFTFSISKHFIRIKLIHAMLLWRYLIEFLIVLLIIIYFAKNQIVYIGKMDPIAFKNCGYYIPDFQLRLFMSVFTIIVGSSSLQRSYVSFLNGCTSVFIGTCIISMTIKPYLMILFCIVNSINFIISYSAHHYKLDQLILLYLIAIFSSGFILDILHSSIINLSIFAFCGIVLYLFWALLAFLIPFFIDIYTLLIKKPQSKQLQRKKFADTLNSIFVLQNLYIKMCEKKEIVFCGQWPENQRPATGIDDIDYRIYKLDIRGRKDIHID